MKNWLQYKPSIWSYSGKWVDNWFSNMKIQPMRINNYNYQSVENFYQACKTDNALIHLAIASADPHQAKKMGRQVDPLIDNWDVEKHTFMEIGLRHKFSFPEWKERLLTIEPHKPIIEWNNWGDTYWGVSTHTNKGFNHLGLLLTQLRTELQQNKNLLDVYNPDIVDFTQFN